MKRMFMSVAAAVLLLVGAARADYVATNLVMNLDANVAASRNNFDSASSGDGTVYWKDLIDTSGDQDFQSLDSSATYDLNLGAATSTPPSGIAYSYFLHSANTTDGDGVRMSASSSGAINGNQSELSIEIWFRADALGEATKILFSSGGGTMGKAIRLHDPTNDGNSTMDLDFGINGGSTNNVVTASEAIGDTAWHQVVGVFKDKDGSTDGYMRLYLDGSATPLAEVTLTTALGSTNGSGTPYVGGGGGVLYSAGGRFNGELSIIRYYDVALTGEQVNQNYLAVTAIPEPTTVAFLALGGLGLIGSAVRRRRRA